MTRHSCYVCCMAMLIAGLVAPAVADSVTLTNYPAGWYNLNQVYWGPYASQQHVGSVYSYNTLPASSNLSQNSAGYSGTSILQSQSAFGFDRSGLTVSFDQSRTGAIGDTALTLGEAGFIVNSSVTYSVSGYLDVVGGTGYVGLDSNLYDETTKQLVFNYASRNIGSGYDAVLGVNGNAASGGGGPMGGTLNAGDTYVLFYRAYTQTNVNTADTGATATGMFSFSLSDSANGAAAPLPATVWMGLVFLGVFGADQFRRRRCRASSAGSSFWRL